VETKYSFKYLEKVMVEETIKSLTEKPIKSTTYERAILLKEADDLYSDLPQPLKYGKGYCHFLEFVIYLFNVHHRQ